MSTYVIILFVIAESLSSIVKNILRYILMSYQNFSEVIFTFVLKTLCTIERKNTYFWLRQIACVLKHRNYHFCSWPCIGISRGSIFNHVFSHLSIKLILGKKYHPPLFDTFKAHVFKLTRCESYENYNVPRAIILKM